jgi:hypothetical protein
MTEDRVTWTKVGGKLNTKTTSVRGTELYFHTVDVADRGVYICSLENEAGASRASSILEVERRERPAIEVYPSENQTVVKGGSVLYQCRVLSGIPNPDIVWTRLDGGSSFGNNVEILANGGVIRITDIQKSNEGRFKCTATNLAGSATATAFLKVTVAPNLTLNPRGSVQVSLGQEIRLVCQGTGDPIPMVHWERLGQGYMTPMSPSQGSATYVMPRITKEDEGSYVCKATSDAGHVEEVVQIVVLEDLFDQQGNSGGSDGSNDVGGQDEVVSVQQQALAPLGGNAELSCQIVGTVGGLRVQWLRMDGQPLSSNSEERNGILIIRDVQHSDGGPYGCQALDQTGRVIFTATTTLVISGKTSKQLKLHEASHIVGQQHGAGASRNFTSLYHYIIRKCVTKS